MGLPLRPTLVSALLFLPLLAFLPSASAQLPVPVEESAVAFAFSCPQAMLEVAYKGTTQTTCYLYDLTHDSPYAPGQAAPASAVQHITTLTIGGRFPTDAPGWQVILERTYIATYGGETVPIQVTVQTTPQIDTADFTFQILANYTGPNDHKLNQTVTLAAQVDPYDIAHVQTLDQVKRAGQFEVVKYVVAVSNDGVFPDVYEFEARAPAGFQISVPPGLYVPPGQTRNTTFTVLTPHGKIYELGRSVSFEFKVRSTMGTGVYSSVGVLNVRGPYVPVYWIPLLLVGVVSAAIVARSEREQIETRRLEKGRPRRVEITPRQAVLLAELKRADPEAYKQRKAQLDAIYAERRLRYRDFRKEQAAHDREEHRQAMVELKQQKKLRAEQRKADKARRKLEAKLAKANAKAQRREAKLREKELKRKRKELERAKAKQEKLDAKQAARDAKAQAKADKLAAQQAKAAQKAARAAEKAARKGGSPPPPPEG